MAGVQLYTTVNQKSEANNDNTIAESGSYRRRVKHLPCHVAGEFCPREKLAIGTAVKLSSFYYLVLLN